MNILSNEWKRQRFKLIVARKRPKKGYTPRKPIDPDTLRAINEASAKKRWNNPEYREKMKRHPWRGNQVVH